MKKDNWITLIVIITTLLLIFAVTRDFFLTFSSNYKLLGGFIKFFLLASIGDVIGLKLKTKKWSIPNRFLSKAIVWGFIGVVIVLIFGIYSSGVVSLQEKGILPFENSAFFTAFFISLIMNATFAPTMMAFHRMTDTYFDLKSNQKNVTLTKVINTIDWTSFIQITVLKVIPIFWIPMHTITFMLDAKYQVLFAAVLGIFLGLLLGLFNRKKVITNDEKKSN